MAGARSPDQGSHKVKKVLPAIPSEFRAEHAPPVGGRGSRTRERRAVQAIHNVVYSRDENMRGESEREATSQPASPATPTTPVSPSSQANGRGVSSPPSPPASPSGVDTSEVDTDTYDPDSIPPPPSRTKALPIVPAHQPDTSASPEGKRKAGYFAIGKSFTFPRLVTHARPKFGFKKTKDRKTPSSHHTGETTHSLPTVLPTLPQSSPISHMLPTEYFPEDYNENDDDRSDAQTTPELTIDDLYHLVLNIQKGFQVQIEEMSSQIKELKREIRRLKNEESEEEDDDEEEDDLEDLMLRRSAAGTAASVRSTTRELDRHADTGRWFHNDNM